MPKLKEATVNYSVSVNCNLGKNSYESYKVQLSKGLTFDVSDLTDEEAAKFLQEQRELIKEELDPIIEAEYNENSCFAE